MTYQEIPEFENLTHESGLYLIGNCTFNPYTNEKFYWIKIGLSTDIQNRMRTYRSHSPSIWIIDTLELDYCMPQLIEIEEEYHTSLSTFFNGRAIAKNSKEWFQISKQNYIEICQKGFNIFNEHWGNHKKALEELKKW